MVNAAQFPDRIETSVPALTARHSRSLIVHAENALGTSAISEPASRMSQVIPTPASLVQLRLQQARQPSQSGSEGAKRRDGSHRDSTLLASLREQRTPIGPPPL